MRVLSLSELESFDSKSTNFGKQRRFLCPFCGENKPKDLAHRSLAVNTENGLYICHRCQSKGCLQEFQKPRLITSKLNNRNLKLKSQFSFTTKEKPANITDKQENLLDKMTEYQTEFLHSPAEIYLLNRCISTDTAINAGCGYAANWEHWEKKDDKWILQGTDRRVVFPVYDYLANLVAIHARAIDANFIGSSKITKGDKSKGLFLSDADVLNKDLVCICEGAIDALALHVMGKSAAAMIGTSPPDWFARKMIFKTVQIATDADEAGDKAAIKLKLELDNCGVKNNRLRPENVKDWGEYLENNTEQFIK